MNNYEVMKKGYEKQLSQVKDRKKTLEKAQKEKETLDKLKDEIESERQMVRDLKGKGALGKIYDKIIGRGF